MVDWDHPGKLSVGQWKKLSDEDLLRRVVWATWDGAAGKLELRRRMKRDKCEDLIDWLAGEDEDETPRKNKRKEIEEDDDDDDDENWEPWKFAKHAIDVGWQCEGMYKREESVARLKLAAKKKLTWEKIDKKPSRVAEPIKAFWYGAKAHFEVWEIKKQK